MPRVSVSLSFDGFFFFSPHYQCYELIALCARRAYSAPDNSLTLSPISKLNIYSDCARHEQCSIDSFHVTSRTQLLVVLVPKHGDHYDVTALCHPAYVILLCHFLQRTFSPDYHCCRFVPFLVYSACPGTSILRWRPR